MSHREIFYYDTRSNLTCVRDDDLGLTYYAYDAGNRMTSVKNPFGEVAYYEYTPGGRMTKRILGNGCVTYYDHDAIGRVAKVDNRKSDLSVISSFEYQRDPVGNPLSILREDGSAVYYEYDPKHQLTRETQRDSQGQDLYAWEWDYDAAGNRTYQIFNGETTCYEYNAANELTQETTNGQTTYYAYDRCGNTTAKQEAEGTTYYHWDYENLLTQIDLPDGAHNYFTYDADSKRVSKQDSEGYTEFVYQGPDMLKLLMERDETGQTQAHYTMGNGLEAMRRNTTSSFYHYDEVGSTQELTDSEQDVTDTYLHNAWGEVLGRTGTTINAHAFVGRQRYYLEVDPEVDLLGLRYYSSKRARFLTLDPLALLRPYAYAGNNPLIAVDPTGLAQIQLRHVVVSGASNTDVINWSQQAAKIWHALTVGQVEFANWDLTPNVHDTWCVRHDAHKTTVHLDKWVNPGYSREYCMGLQEATIKEYVRERYGYTVTPGGPGVLPKNPTAVWMSSSALHVDPKERTLGMSGLGSGWMWMFWGPMAAWSPDPASTLAHELGHGVFHLTHTWCGLMYGYAGSVRRTRRCLACGPGGLPSSVRELKAFGIAVPPFRQCEPNLATYFPGQPPSICEPEEHPPGVAVPIPVLQVELLGWGPCQ